MIFIIPGWELLLDLNFFLEILIYFSEFKFLFVFVSKLCFKVLWGSFFSFFPKFVFHSSILLFYFYMMNMNGLNIVIDNYAGIWVMCEGHALFKLM